MPYVKQNSMRYSYSKFHHFILSPSHLATIANPSSMARKFSAPLSDANNIVL
jgi:hypothetical protein